MEAAATAENATAFPSVAWKTLRVSHSSHRPDDDERRGPRMCYPCARSEVLPMSQAVQSLGQGQKSSRRCKQQVMKGLAVETRPG